MTGTNRAKKIESYGKAHAVLVDALKQFPREMWQFKPAPDHWSVHEIAVHIADSEANSYVRCRRFIAEPGSTVQGYDEMRWAEALNYHGQSVEESLELFKWLRRRSYEVIKGLPEAAWSSTAHHTEYGTMTMDKWLDMYERHIPEHVAQMQEAYQLWLSQSGSSGSAVSNHE